MVINNGIHIFVCSARDEEGPHIHCTVFNEGIPMHRRIADSATTVVTELYAFLHGYLAEGRYALTNGFKLLARDAHEIKCDLVHTGVIAEMFTMHWAEVCPASTP